MKRRASGSAQTSASTWAKGRAGRASTGAGARAGSTRHRAITATRKAIADTPLDTATRRDGENGSMRCPAVGAVTTKPAIIMIQTIVAAAPRRWGATPVESSTRSEVPAAPTPMPTPRKDRTRSP